MRIDFDRLITDCGEAADLQRSHWQGGRNGVLILGARSADGNLFHLLLLRLLFGVEFSSNFRMRNGYKLPHKIREFAEIACFILGGLSWLLRHARYSLEREYRSGVRSSIIVST